MLQPLSALALLSALIFVLDVNGRASALEKVPTESPTALWSLDIDVKSKIEAPTEAPTEMWFMDVKLGALSIPDDDMSNITIMNITNTTIANITNTTIANITNTTFGTLEPTPEPSAMPTDMPTDIPTPLPSAIPTVMPTSQPTTFPTPGPTLAPSFAISTTSEFPANMEMVCDGCLDTPEGIAVFEETNAEQLGVPADQVSVNSVTQQVTTSSIKISDIRVTRRLTNTYDIDYAVTFIVNSLLSGDVDAAYAQLSATLEESVNSGAFNTALQAAAADAGLTALAEATADAVAVEDYEVLETYTPSPSATPTALPTANPTKNANRTGGSGPDRLSNGAVIGICFAGAGFLIIIGYGAYIMIFFKEGTASPAKYAPPGVVAGNNDAEAEANALFQERDSMPEGQSVIATEGGGVAV
jgi:hypothetical protein